MQPDPTKPYNALPELPPAAELETKPVLKRCVAAHRALAELNLAGRLIPDQSVLINTIPLLEAKASSEIENIVTTNDALFREASDIDEDGDPAAKEALRYRSALNSGYHALKGRPLTARTAVEICGVIKGFDIDVRRTPGTQLRNTFTGEVIYTPPEGADRLRALLANWERYLHADDDTDPLVRMAVLHYQFEAIHPFPDGNGRTGRILNLLILVHAGLLDMPTLYLSRHILKTRPDYYRLLQAVTMRQEWEPWIVYLLAAVETTASWTNLRIRAIRDLIEHTGDYVRARAPAIYSHELIQAIFAQPYSRIAHLSERGIAKRVSASRYLKQLAAIGVLQEEKHGRDKLFIHRKYMQLLASDEHAFEPYGARTRPSSEVEPVTP
ncbi:MAG: Fic family protein [Hyphomicrobiaceae bacterium]|nr:Fic family protein [Hyphomicrobiaceae bacterium]